MSRFNAQYESLQSKFAAEYGDRRVPCSIHTIQLVISDLPKVPKLLECLTAAKKMVTNIKGKRFTTYRIVTLFVLEKKAGQDLKKIAGKGVVLHCQTRFSTNYLLIDRLLELQPYLASILSANKIDNITVEQWALLGDCRRLLQPFVEFTDMLAIETDATISMVIPTVRALDRFLKVIVFILILKQFT